MKNKQIARIIFQTVLVMVTVFVILEFYQFDTIPYMVKCVSTIALIVLNCVYNHWCGMRNGIEMSEIHENRMRELRKQSFDNIVDMVVEEKINAER